MRDPPTRLLRAWLPADLLGHGEPLGDEPVAAHGREPARVAVAFQHDQREWVNPGVLPHRSGMHARPVS